MSRAGAEGGTYPRLAPPEPPPVVALVVVEVVARADRRPPPLVVPVPVDRQREPVREPRARLPAERPHPVGGQRVAAVVAGPVGHVLDQRLVPPRQREDAADELEVRLLVGPADVVDLARLATREHD